MERSGTPPLALLSAFPVMTPVMTKERFAALVGVEVGVVRGMLDRGHLPSIKIGRHRLINVAALQVVCLEEYCNLAFGVREEPPQYGRC